jgi:hypothetical protein
MQYVNLDTYALVRSVAGRIVTVLDATHDSRGIRLIASYSRALPRYSIHELILTDEPDKKPGDKVNHIAYLGFFEVTEGGCLVVGEELSLNNKPIGTLIGFDETHEPNHINIIIQNHEFKTGHQSGWKIEDNIQFDKRT